MNALMDPAARADRAAASRARRRPHGAGSPNRSRAVAPRHRGAAAKCAPISPIPAAPYLDRKIRAVPHLAEVWSYINPFMLYGRHLGYKGNFEKDLAAHDPKALDLFHRWRS